MSLLITRAQTHQTEASLLSVLSLAHRVPVKWVFPAFIFPRSTCGRGPETPAPSWAEAFLCCRGDLGEESPLVGGLQDPQENSQRADNHSRGCVHGSLSSQAHSLTYVLAFDFWTSPVTARAHVQLVPLHTRGSEMVHGSPNVTQLLMGRSEPGLSLPAQRPFPLQNVILAGFSPLCSRTSGPLPVAYLGCLQPYRSVFSFCVEEAVWYHLVAPQPWANCFSETQFCHPPRGQLLPHKAVARVEGHGEETPSTVMCCDL